MPIRLFLGGHGLEQDIAVACELWSEAQLPPGRAVPAPLGHESSDGAPTPRDDDLLSPLYALDERGEASLGIVDVDGLYSEKTRPGRSGAASALSTALPGASRLTEPPDPALDIAADRPLP